MYILCKVTCAFNNRYLAVLQLFKFESSFFASSDFEIRFLLLRFHYLFLHLLVCVFRVSSLSVGGAVVSWLVSSTPDRAVRVRAQAGDIVLFSWARHFTLTAPLSTQMYKWVPAGGNPAMDWHPIQGGVALFLVA